LPKPGVAESEVKCWTPTPSPTYPKFPTITPGSDFLKLNEQKFLWPTIL